MNLWAASGPVAYWRPVNGVRHALEPNEPPQVDQERQALCGDMVTVTATSDVAWLAPTCDFCWAEATSRRDARHRRA